MSSIKLLSENVINKIAAGEIIERPASVVKELVENSLDAAATIINIELVNSGKKMVAVRDNGQGMDKEDAVLSIERHATSKIMTENDLFSISSLGFRGEALASMAAVSAMKITTKKHDSEGVELGIEYGKIIKSRTAACNQGTSVEVNDLFSNTPVRKNYLKDDYTELNHILNIVIRYALARPEIYFRLVNNGKIILSSPATENKIDNIVSVYGKDIAKNLIEVNYMSDTLEVKGFIGKPGIARKDKSLISVFVNSRYVSNKEVNDALYDAYHTLLFLNLNPVAIISINADPSKVDVNVHPTKSEVKFDPSINLYKEVHAAVKAALINNNLIQDADSLRTSGLFDAKGKKYDIEKGKQLQLETEAVPIAYKKQHEEKGKLPKIELIGQLNKTYILAESDSGLVIIDQHAAEERINFERFMKQFKDGNLAVQKLIKPALMEFTILEANVIRENLDFLKKMGYELDEYSENTFMLRTVPDVFNKIYDKNFMLELVEELEVSSRELEAVKEEKIASKACRKSVKAGDILNLLEMKALYDKLGACEQPYNCPHGRPSIINIPISELEKKFKRVA